LSHIIIGTAGHVDHGKTMLIKALTGRDTDRLREEKERGISIDLGFAPFDLPGGRRAGVVDVPGHERFINNMLAGIGGIDLVLLVVDVTEGVMPQTREHLAILELLKIQRGIVILTKVDLAEEEWIDLVEEEVRQELKDTFLHEAPMHRVSVVTQAGIEELKHLIDEMTAVIPPRDESAPLRMPVDRVFSIAGFGTVLTGTLLAGSVRGGEEVEILPAGEKVRVRQVQVHDVKVDQALAGQRVALNLAHLEKDLVSRGSVVTTPGYFRATSLVDARLNLLALAKHPLKNLTPLHFYLGTGRVVARVVLLEGKELKPGENALVQFRLEKPLVAHRQDRFIVRSYSPVTTVGGGIVIDHHPARHKRFRPEIIESLKYLEEGDPAEYVLQQLQKKSPQTVKDLSPSVRLAPPQLAELLKGLEEQGKIVQLEGFYALSTKVEEWLRLLEGAMEDFHKRKNLAEGISRALLRGTLDRDLPARAYDALISLLERKGNLVVKGDILARAGFEPMPSAAQRALLQKMEGAFKESGFSPPGLRDVGARVGLNQEDLEALAGYLVDRGSLVKVSEDLYFSREHYEKALETLRQLFAAEGKVTLATLRDALQTSRKYVQALLEYLDQQKITRRDGDYRYPRKL
jgi:selenocysteine-specific elongation factor